MIKKSAESVKRGKKCIRMNTTKSEKCAALSFDYLYHKYRNYVWVSAYRAKDDFHWCEDITQNIFIKLFKHMNAFENESDAFENEAKAFAWLKRVIENTIRDELKKDKTYTSHHDFNGDKDLEKYGLDFQSEPLDNMTKIEIARDIRTTVDNLNPKYAEVVRLHYFKDFTVKEIAHWADISPNTIYSRLSKAKTLLYDKIDESIKIDYRK